MHLLADRRHRARPDGRGRPDRRRLAVGAGAVHAGRGPVAHEPDGRYRRGGYRAGRRRQPCPVHGRGLPGQGLRGDDHPVALRAGGSRRRGHLQGDPRRREHRPAAAARHDGDRRHNGGQDRRRADRAERGDAFRATGRGQDGGQWRQRTAGHADAEPPAIQPGHGSDRRGRHALDLDPEGRHADGGQGAHRAHRRLAHPRSSKAGFPRATWSSPTWIPADERGRRHAGHLAQGHHPRLWRGRSGGPRAARHRHRDRQRRIRRHHGTERFRQVDGDEHHRRARFPDAGQLPLPGRRCRRLRPAAARPAAPRLPGLRLPGLQPAGAHIGARQRRAAADLQGREARRKARTGDADAGTGRARPAHGQGTVETVGRRTAARGNRAGHSLGTGGAAGRRNRPAISTRRARRRSWS